MKRKFAVFDIDGTYFRNHLYGETTLSLAREKKFPEDINTLALSLYKQWKERSHNKAYVDFDRQTVTKINKSIHLINPADLDTAIEKSLSSKLDHVYMYTKSLKEKLQADGYMILAISGSKQEELDLFCRHHGFDDWVGQTWQRSTDGLSFTGEIDFSHNRKKELLEKLVEKHNLNYRDSYGIGDTSSDIDFLDMVDNPIAFNPNHSLLEYAQKKGWKIVIERKSIAYTLEKGENGQYLLAETK